MLGMHLTDERIEGFCKVSVCENVTESAVTVMHHAGIGSLQPNTVITCLAWCLACSVNGSASSRRFARGVVQWAFFVGSRGQEEVRLSPLLLLSLLLLMLLLDTHTHTHTHTTFVRFLPATD